MIKIQYTDKEIENWINKTDSELSIETWEEFFPDDEDKIDFQLFYESYQKKHIQKFGYELKIQLD